MSRVLVLDPNADIRELFARMLRRLGHEPVLDAEAAAELDAVLVEPASAAALDTLADVRERRADVYVVCASICPREQAAAAACDAFIAKPVSLAALEAALAHGPASV